jgi:mitochondrial fission protein ELM1
MADSATPIVWILTDGKAGDEQPLIGLAEAMGVRPVLRRVAPRRFFAWMMPWGPIDPRDGGRAAGLPLAPPYPDICLATGRRAVPYLRRLKALSPDTFCVLFKDPRTRRNGADLLVVQEHDALRGDNVLVVTTAPNRLSPGRLAAARSRMSATLSALPSPRAAVLVGGDSRHHRFTPGDIERLVEGLRARIAGGAALMITASRRTPADLVRALADLAAAPGVVFWDGTGENPLIAYLAFADEVIVTADSTNMMGEAAALGVPVQVFRPTGGHPKIDRFIAALSREAAIGRFPDAPATGRPAPVNVTPGLARDVLSRWKDFLRSRRARPS